MNENTHEPNLQEALDKLKNHPEHKHKWKRIHHTWYFWVFLALMLFAILYYNSTVNFAFAPWEIFE